MFRRLAISLSVLSVVAFGLVNAPRLAEAAAPTPWNPISVAVAGNPLYGNLYSVDCVGATCTAVGRSFGSANHGLIVTNSSGTWESSLIPEPSGGTESLLSRVSCGDTLCAAIGIYYNGTSWQDLIATNASGSWASTSISAPNGGNSVNLNSVNCVGSVCTAVGYYDDRTTDEGIIVTNASGSWTSTSVPAPNGGSTVFLNSVNCVGVTCTAVGQYNNGTTDEGLVVTNASGTWASTSIPAPNGGGSENLNAVNCVRVTCTAVGLYNDGTTDEGVVVSNASGTWASTSIPAPNGGSDVSLGSVNCGGSTCTAVGQYNNGTTDEGLVVTNASGTWASTSIPAPNGGSNTTLRSVSCIGSLCTAAGGYEAGSIGDGLIVSNASGSWVSTSLAAPNGALHFPNDLASPGFQNVSCSEQNCVAAGAYTTATSLFGFLAQSTLPANTPYGVSARAGDGQATISWSTSDEAGTSYTATASPGGATCVTTSTSCTISGLRNGTTYSVSVTATNAAGTSDPSTPVSVVLAASGTLAATGMNLTIPLGLATALLGLGGLGVVESQRKRRRA